jgi:hypothetical protein
MTQDEFLLAKDFSLAFEEFKKGINEIPWFLV